MKENYIGGRVDKSLVEQQIHKSNIINFVTYTKSRAVYLGQLVDIVQIDRLKMS